MDLQTIILTVAVPLGLAGLAMAGRWLAAKYAERDLLARAFLFLELMGKRGRDKYQLEIEKAKSPDSPGGQEITPEERSELRQRLWNIALAEAPGAIREVLLDQIGAEQGKAVIGEALVTPVGN